VRHFKKENLHIENRTLTQNKNIIKILHLFLISFIIATIVAVGQSSDEIEIKQLEKHWTELLNKEDTTSLLRI